MRWAGRIILALFLAWAIYFISPYVSLFGLATAIETKDVTGIEQRVNFRAVRVSVAKQLIPAYLIATGQESELKGAKGQAVAGIGATIADPLLAEYLSPAALGGLFNDARLTGGGGLSRDIDLNSLRDVWRLVAAAQSRGFRMISFAVPPDKPDNEQFRLHLRINGFGWRLAGIDLPKPVLDRLVRELIRSNPPAS